MSDIADIKVDVDTHLWIRISSPSSFFYPYKSQTKKPDATVPLIENKNNLNTR
jgi:hypothetical protein